MFDFYLDKHTLEELISKKEFKLIVDYIVEQYDTGAYNQELFPILEKTLIDNNEIQLFKKFWNHILATRIKRFWYHYDHYNSFNHNRMPKGLLKFFQRKESVIDRNRITTEELLSVDKAQVEKNHSRYPGNQDSKLNLIWDWYEVLELIDIYIERMQKIGATEEIERVKFLKESVYNLKKPKAKKTTDKRKMSEELFWELIDESRKESEFDSDFVEILKEKLEAMSATEIKKFQKLLLEKMNELNHWDIWALAYIVRKGCGDDEFDYFKAWVVSKGKEVFEDLKEMKLEKLKKPFKDSDAQLEEFMYVAQNAYENKQYEEMPMPRVKNTPIQGKEWSEDNICKDYPELCKMFNYS